MTGTLISYATFVEVRERRGRIAADFIQRSSETVMLGGQGPELPLTLDSVQVGEQCTEAGELPPDNVDSHGRRFQGIGGAVARPSRAIVDL